MLHVQNPEVHQFGAIKFPQMGFLLFHQSTITRTPMICFLVLTGGSLRAIQSILTVNMDQEEAHLVVRVEVPLRLHLKNFKLLIMRCMIFRLVVKIITGFSLHFSPDTGIILNMNHNKSHKRKMLLI